METSQIVNGIRKGDISIIPDIVNGPGIDKLGYGYDGSSTVLHMAVNFGQVDFCRRLLGVGANAKIANKDGELAIHLAAKHGHIDIARVIIKMGGLSFINVRCSNDTKQAGIHIASCNGHAEFVQMLVEEQEANEALLANYKGHKNLTALHMAIYAGKPEPVAFLAKCHHGKLLRITDSQGQSPLKLAVKLGDAPCARALAQNGADIEFVDPDTGLNSFLEAVQLNQMDVAAVFVTDCNTNINARSKKGGTGALSLATQLADATSVARLLELGADKNMQDDSGNSALHLATKLKELDIIGVLCRAGANVDIRNKIGRTPLGLLAAGHGELVTAKELIENYKADADIKSGKNDFGGATVFQLACLSKNFDLASYLLSGDKDRCTANSRNGENAVHICASHGDEESVKYLLDNGCPMDKPCSNGRLALHKAAIGDRAGVVALLLERGADRKARSKFREDDNFDAAMLATKHGSFKVFQLLKPPSDSSEQSKEFIKMLHESIKLSGSPDITRAICEQLQGVGSIDSPGFFGRTALHIACIYGRLEAARVLIEFGTDVNARSAYEDNGRTALHFAALFGQEDFVELLLQNGATLTKKDCSSHTPLHLAALAGWCHITELLVASGIDVGIRGKGQKTPLHMACMWVGELDENLPTSLRPKSWQLDENKKEPASLWEANFPELAIPMEKKKAIDDDNDEDDLFGKKPKDKVEFFTTTLFSIDAYDNKMRIVKLLVKELPALATVRDKKNDLAVHVAANTGHFAIVQYLIDWKRHLFLESKGYHGRTPLLAAAYGCQFSICLFLLESKSNPNCKSSSSKDVGRAPIHVLASEGPKSTSRAGKSLAIIQLLLKFKAEADITDAEGDRALHLAIESACRYGSFWLDAVGLLIDGGSNLEASGKNGHAPLERAACSAGDNVAVVDFLVRRGVKVKLTPNHIRPINYIFEALDLARASGNTKTAHYLANLMKR